MGLFSSGSTWAFNVVAGLLRLTGGQSITSLYADDIDEAVLRAIEQCNRFALKTHLPASPVRVLCQVARLPVVLTVRDPRDAVTSLMQRFGQDFATAIDRIERSANLALYMYERLDPLVLKYEDGFVGEPGIASIAAHLGVALSASDKQQLRDHLSPDAVAQRVQDLVDRGVLRGDNPAEEWERGTEWHPNHVGDGRIGKYQYVLTMQESDAVIYATRPFCRAFGYCTNHTDETAPTTTEGATGTSMEGWIDHFVPPDLVGGWARLRSANHRLKIRAHREGQIIGQTLADLRRPDLVGMGDGYVGFQLRLPVPITLDELIRSVEICAACGTSELGCIKPTPELTARAQTAGKALRGRRAPFSTSNATSLKP